MQRTRLIATVAALLGGAVLLSGREIPFIGSLGSLGGALGLGGGTSAAALDEGARLASPGIALAGGASADVRKVSSFFAPTAETETPVAARDLAELPGCTFRAPRAGEVIGNVHVGRGGLAVPVAAQSRRDLAALALARLRALRAGTAPATPAEPGPMRAVDVFVTERGAPVYLILQSGAGDVLWNVQPSPGARIAHVAVIAAGQVALQIPGGIPVETLRVAEHPDCAVAPVRQPDPAWPIFRRGVRLEDRVAAFAAYDAWFRDRFGTGAEANVVGFHETSHALVGPLPAPHEKVMQTRLGGATIAVSDAPLARLGGEAARAGQTAAAVERLMASAAPGDAAALAHRTVRRGE